MYCKYSENWDTKNSKCKCHEMEVWFSTAVMHLKDADGMASSVAVRLLSKE